MVGRIEGVKPATFLLNSEVHFETAPPETSRVASLCLILGALTDLSARLNKIRQGDLEHNSRLQQETEKSIQSKQRSALKVGPFSSVNHGKVRLSRIDDIPPAALTPPPLLTQEEQFAATLTSRLLASTPV